MLFNLLQLHCILLNNIYFHFAFVGSLNLYDNKYERNNYYDIKYNCGVIYKFNIKFYSLTLYI